MSVDDILGRARKKASQIDPDLARKVERKEHLEKKYNHNPLRIRIPAIPALLSGKFKLVFQVTATWKPASGLVVQWGSAKVADPTGEIPGDREALSCTLLADAPEPDINYVWFIDIVRSFQGFLNWVRKLLAIRQKPRLDLWGDIFIKAKGGGETIYVPMATHPARTARLLKKLSGEVVTGNQAFAKLVGRADEGKLKGGE